MASKMAVYPLVIDHFRTLRDVRTDRISKRDVALQYGAPVLVAGFAVWLGARLVAASQVIAGIAVLAAFSFGIAVFVFQLRLEATRDPRVHKGDRLLTLIDELFDNVNYSILAGLLLLLVTMAGVAYGGDKHMNAWWSLAITSLGIHYILVILMCLKRLRSAYDALTI